MPQDLAWVSQLSQRDETTNRSDGRRRFRPKISRPVKPIQGRLLSHLDKHFKPSASGGSVALEVEDFAAATRELKEYRSKFVIEPVEFPGCHMAAVLDPDGNTISIHKRKATNP
jgi:catechol 2,3-dioxygenase-like lactoylglutathione lyase family enzyme